MKKMLIVLSSLFVGSILSISAEPLVVSQSTISLSGVKGVKSTARTIKVTNPNDSVVKSKIQLSGQHIAAFQVSDFPEELKAMETRELTVEFVPSADAQGPVQLNASLQIGELATGVKIDLQGVSLAKFEGKNEPTLEQIVNTFGIPLNVGGSGLHLDTENEKLGDSVIASYFIAVEGKKVKLTPLARFSPRGAVTLSILKKGMKDGLAIGTLADVSKKFPDAHQSILPPLVSGKQVLEFPGGAFPFALSIKGTHYQLSTDEGISQTKKVKHESRVYPVKSFQGRKVKNAYLIGFEEAKNGDYQDALFLLENVVVAE